MKNFTKFLAVLLLMLSMLISQASHPSHHSSHHSTHSSHVHHMSSHSSTHSSTHHKTAKYLYPNKSEIRPDYSKHSSYPRYYLLMHNYHTNSVDTVWGSSADQVMQDAVGKYNEGAAEESADDEKVVKIVIGVLIAVVGVILLLIFSYAHKIKKGNYYLMLALTMLSLGSCSSKTKEPLPVPVQEGRQVLNSDSLLQADTLHKIFTIEIESKKETFPDSLLPYRAVRYQKKGIIEPKTSH